MSGSEEEIERIFEGCTIKDFSEYQKVHYGNINPSGYCENCRVNNIYDMTQNVFECTLESYSYGRVKKGGYSTISGSSGMENRSYFYTTEGEDSSKDELNGSRLTLII